MTEPKLTSAVVADGLRVTGQVVTIDIRPAPDVDEARRTLFYAFQRVHWYRRARENKKLPPFVELAMAEELKKHRIVPSEINLEIRHPKQTVRTKTVLEIEPLSAEEHTRVTEVVAKYAAR
jgi:hypothetical protein